MKFTCDSCSAQYMISDEKVGPNGVKVRCKKCGNVIVVRRARRRRAPPRRARGRRAGARPARGLDAELGKAFDHAFGDPPQQAPAPAAASPDLGDTQAMGPDDAAQGVRLGGPAPAATEWYVAIGQAQVGPLPLAEVKKKWEAGDVGPDSLVWRPGMGDWSPLTTVSELAGVPRAGAAPGAAAVAAPSAGAAAAPPAPSRSRPPSRPGSRSAPPRSRRSRARRSRRAAPAPSRARRPCPRRAAGRSSTRCRTAAASIPTGASRCNIKALEATTGEKKIERRSSVARERRAGAPPQHHARSGDRRSLVGILLVGGPRRRGVLPLPEARGSRPPPRSPPRRRRPRPPRRRRPPRPPAAAPPPARARSRRRPPRRRPPRRLRRSAPAAGRARRAAAEAAAPARRETRRDTARRGARRRAPPRGRPRREARRRRPPPPPAPRKKGDDLLDFESNDAALDAALGGGAARPGPLGLRAARARRAGCRTRSRPATSTAPWRSASTRSAAASSEQKAREPDATGTLKMRWIIQADGSPHDVKCITPEYAKGAFAQCIGGRASRPSSSRAPRRRVRKSRSRSTSRRRRHEAGA